MTEREQEHFPDRAKQEQEQWELIRLNEVEGFIQKKANRFCMGDPMLAEDLAQEGREAVIRRLREDPVCPYSHLVLKARDAIYHYRACGSSVDGKLHPVGRSKQYKILNFEDPITDDTLPLAEALADPRAPHRPTEERACRNISFDDLRDFLSAEENQILTLRLMGTSWLEVRETLGKSIKQIAHIREVMTIKAHYIISDVL